MISTRITRLFEIDYPIIAGGMAWCSGWRLAAAVSNAGGLGLIGAGSMSLPTLQEHLQRIKAATQKPWGVNIPLMMPDAEAAVELCIAEGAPIVFTSAGSPKRFTPRLHEAGIKVAHVVAGSRFARKCEEAGVDAVVAEGFEAGGHNGREETTTLVLTPAVCGATSLPVIAAGGIASGRALLAALALGAEGVQIGSLFAMSQESSAAEAFKQRCVELGEGDTMLALKKLAPTRLVKNALYDRIAAAEATGASADELRALVPAGSARRGMFEGDVTDGELEIGQVAAQIDAIRPVAQIMQTLIDEYAEACRSLAALNK